MYVFCTLVGACSQDYNLLIVLQWFNGVLCIFGDLQRSCMYLSYMVAYDVKTFLTIMVQFTPCTTWIFTYPRNVHGN